MGFLKSQQLHVGGGVEVKLAIKTDVILQRGSEQLIIKRLPSSSWDGNRKLPLSLQDITPSDNVIWLFSSFGSGKNTHTSDLSQTSLGTGGWSSMTQDALEGNETKVFYSLVHLLSHCPQPAATEWEEFAHAPASHGRADGAEGGWPASPSHGRQSPDSG